MLAMDEMHGRCRGDLPRPAARQKMLNQAMQTTCKRGIPRSANAARELMGVELFEKARALTMDLRDKR